MQGTGSATSSFVPTSCGLQGVRRDTVRRFDPKPRKVSWAVDPMAAHAGREGEWGLQEQRKSYVWYEMEYEM